MKLKVMRTCPRTLQEAIQIATTEQILFKRFQLRTGHDLQLSHDETRHEPMDIGHFRKQQCYYCKKYGHVQKDCRKKKREVSTVTETNDKPKRKPIDRTKLVCFRCQQIGHFASECKNTPSQSNDTAPHM
jgi:hypothetical protein